MKNFACDRGLNNNDYMINNNDYNHKKAYLAAYQHALNESATSSIDPRLFIDLIPLVSNQRWCTAM